jgi:hypothetical protein
MSSNKKTLKKISDVDYNGPKKTFTQELTTEEIQSLLEGYKEVNYDDLKKGYHIRYFSKNKNTGKSEFKMGGTVIKIELDYVVLTNGSINWSVQLKNAIFYQQMTMEEIRNDLKMEYDAQLHIKNNEIAKLKLLVKEMKKVMLNKDDTIELLNKKLSNVMKKNEFIMN